MGIGFRASNFESLKTGGQSFGLAFRKREVNAKYHPGRRGAPYPHLIAQSTAFFSSLLAVMAVAVPLCKPRYRIFNRCLGEVLPELTPDALNSPQLHLFIDLNDGCNLKCAMCGVRANFKDQKVLPFELFKSRVAPVFARVADFQLGCACEPLMLPYLGEALGLMRTYMPPERRGQIITNGTLLKESTARRLLESGALGKVRISIDGGTAATFEEIRRGARFEKVMENVARLCRMRSDGGFDVKVEFNYTVMPANHAELPRLIL
ncbi:MAG: radical SAM protein, partial [Rhodospirillales bacterium]